MNRASRNYSNLWFLMEEKDDVLWKKTGYIHLVIQHQFLEVLVQTNKLSEVILTTKFD